MKLEYLLLAIALLAPTVRAAPAAPAAPAAEGERPRRVLLVHSFGRGAPPFTTHSTAFESEIKRELGTAAVDLNEVSLDIARYASPDVEEAFAQFLQKQLSVWQPDVVVPIGSPAGKFVVKYRERLFPQAPVVYTGMDRRTLPADALAKNATFVGESFDIAGLVEDMLQLDPKTNHVVVILGATPLERYWAEEFRHEFQAFDGRVKFTWANDLSFEQTLDLVSKLPEHSFVLLGLLLRDASGVTYNEDAALARLHAVSRAPINGLYQHEVGLGIVGGRLYQGELEGVESARVAARILRGEPASNFAPLVIGTRQPMYDWRELQRWGFSESRLPPGSVVLFRQPTVWERYRWQVIIAVTVIATQAVLLSAMFVQLRRRRIAEAARRLAEADAHQKRAELAHVSRVAVLGELTATLAHEINQPLTAIRSNSYAGITFLDAPEPDLKELRDALCDIEKDSERASEIVRRVRGMLRRDTLGFTSLDPNDVVRTVERLVRHDAVSNGVDVHLELPDDTLAIDGDSVELQQVLLNLMLNAFAAMNDHEPAAGARILTVRTARAGGGSHVLIEVQDRGTGIAADKLDLIFGPFFTSKPDGLGMGLSICRTIIERHKGTIWAANNPDRGATFSIKLPLRHATDPPAQHRVAAETKKNARVAFADPHVPLR